MGDRVLMQCYDNKGNVGPGVYCHLAGDRAPQIVKALRARMKDRPDDVGYSTARLIQEACGNDSGALSFGCFNTEALLTEEDSCGDAGVVLINVSDGHKAKCFGGYLKDSDFE